MAQTILTPDMITKEALRLLHEKCNFIGTVNRQYDSSFAKSGAKIGSALRIRKPARYVTRSGASLTIGSIQDHVEESVTLNVDTQLGVDIAFTSEELTMDLNDFSANVLDGAMAVLASKVEETVLGKAQAAVGTVIDGQTFLDFNKARAYLTNQTAPADNNRVVLVDPLVSATLVDYLKALSEDASQIGKQYREGILGRIAGFNWYENSRIPTVTLPADITGVTVTSIGAADANTGLSSTIVLGGLGADGEVIEAGTAFTVAGVYAVHPESKKTYSYLYTFVVQEDATVATNAATVTVHPFAGPTAGGPRQNISADIAGTEAVTFIGGAGGSILTQCLAYHKDFFTVAFADLVVPNGVDMASRQVYDGISLRFIRDYDLSTDKLVSRIDVLFGSQALRPEYGVKLV